MAEHAGSRLVHVVAAAALAGTLHRASDGFGDSFPRPVVGLDLDRHRNRLDSTS